MNLSCRGPLSRNGGIKGPNSISLLEEMVICASGVITLQREGFSSKFLWLASLGIFFSFKVCEKILYNLCQHPHWSSSTKVTDLVNSMDGMVKVHASLKLDCVDILTAIHGLLGEGTLVFNVVRDMVAVKI
ncbi:hypothetical protein Q3G72_018224 [Acer saccharum]|nr:hypothetical protein Q3G72_018224 [Acer saccharum]